jgi:hypothetical protein
MPNHTIIALLCRCDPHLTITCIAGLLDTRAGIEFDFDEGQRRDFREKGYCLKEFYLPADVFASTEVRSGSHVR